MPTSTSAAAFTQADVGEALVRYGGDASHRVARNPKLLKSTFDLLKAVAEKKPVAGVAAVASGTHAAAKAAGAGKGVQTATKSASFVMSEMKATGDLLKLAKLTSPTAIGIFVGATVVHKTGLAVSLAGSDGERAQCAGALMELAGSAALTAVTAPTGVLLALSALSLTASAYHAYLSCQPAP